MEDLIYSKKFSGKSESLSIKVIKDTIWQKLELNPVYQRKVVWTDEQMRLLVESVICGRSINSISLNREGVDDEEKYTCLDGKQRLTAIFNFFEGHFDPNDLNSKKFKIRIYFETTKKIENYDYKSLIILSKEKDNVTGLKTLKAQEASKILQDFMDFKIDAVKYNDLDLQEQAILFKVINFSSPLTKEEKSLGEFFCAKVMSEYLTLKLKPIIDAWTNVRDAQNLRGKVNKEVLKLFSCFYSHASDKEMILGPRLERVTKADSKGIEKFSAALHYDILRYLDKNKNDSDLFSKHLSTSSDEIEKYFKDRKIDGKIKQYIDIVNLLVEKGVILETSTLGITWWVIIYFSIFILEKIDTGVLTKAQIDNDLEALKNLFKDYRDNYLFGGGDVKDRKTRDLFHDLTKNMAAPSFYRNHIQKLEELFPKHIKDIGLKNKNIPVELKKLGLEFFRDNGSICYMCKHSINENDAHDDHFQPKSLSSNPQYSVILCGTCNLKKTNNDDKSASNLVSYFNTYQNDFEKWYENKYGIKYKKIA